MLGAAAAGGSLWSRCPSRGTARAGRTARRDTSARIPRDQRQPPTVRTATRTERMPIPGLDQFVRSRRVGPRLRTPLGHVRLLRFDLASVGFSRLIGPEPRTRRCLASPPPVKDRTIEAVHARTSHSVVAASERSRSRLGSREQRDAVDRQAATGWPVVSCLGCADAGGSHGPSSRPGQPPDEPRRREPVRREPVPVSTCRTRRQRPLMGADTCGTDT